MENFMFTDMSRIEICRKMAMLCQMSADETYPGVEKEKLQRTCDQFKEEADALAIQDLRDALFWPARV